MSVLPLFDAKLSRADAMVLGVIDSHRRENPVSLAEIQRQTGLRRRMVLSAINRLIMDHRQPIGSSRGKRSGFWLAESIADREIAARPFRRQALNELKRLSVLLSRPDLLEIAGQLRLAEEAGQ